MASGIRYTIFSRQSNDSAAVLGNRQSCDGQGGRAVLNDESAQLPRVPELVDWITELEMLHSTVCEQLYSIAPSEQLFESVGDPIYSNTDMLSEQLEEIQY